MKFEDIPCLTLGAFEALVVVGDQTFGPEKASKKKTARKMAAISALKELIHWQPRGQGGVFLKNFLFCLTPSILVVLLNSPN